MRETTAPAAAAAAVANTTPSTNGTAHPPAALPRIDHAFETCPSRAVAAVETIEADRPADLGEALALVGEGVTAAGNQPLALDDPGAVWRVTSGQVDVFYSRPEPGQDRGRRRHLCRVEEGGSIFGLEGVKSGEQGELVAVGVGPARLLKVPKAELLRLSLESDWRADVAALVDDWVDRISRATAGGDPPKSTAVLEHGQSHEVAEGGRLTAHREVLWVQPGSAGIRFLDKVSVPDCLYESRFPLSTHTWITLQPGRDRPAMGHRDVDRERRPVGGLEAFPPGGARRDRRGRGARDGPGRRAAGGRPPPRRRHGLRAR